MASVVTLGRRFLSRAFHGCDFPSLRLFGSEAGSLLELEKLLNSSSDSTPKQRGEALKMERDYLAYSGTCVPESLTDDMLRQLEQLPTLEERLSRYRYFHQRENHRRRERAEAEKRAAARERQLAERYQDRFGESWDGKTHDSETGLTGLGPLPSFLRVVNDGYVKDHARNHFSFAWSHGQPVVFDMGLELPMTPKENSDFIKQMFWIYASNRSQWEPFDVHLCNANGKSGKGLLKSADAQTFLWSVKEESFLDLWPRRKIVYLTSESTNPLEDYSHDAVYVFPGAVYCRYANVMGRVKELGVDHAYFDLDRVFDVKGFRGMPLNLAFEALLDARDTDGNWPYAFRRFPMRKLTWRPSFSYMKDVPISGERVFANQRAIFKPPFVSKSEKNKPTGVHASSKLSVANYSQRDRQPLRRALVPASPPKRSGNQRSFDDAPIYWDDALDNLTPSGKRQLKKNRDKT